MILDLKDSRGPKYLRLFRALQQGVRSGALAPGAKLPPVRNLAFDLGITPGTVSRAYQLATDEGLLEATIGRGTFVRGRARPLSDVPENLVAAPASEGHLNFRNGHTLDLGQSQLIREVMARVLTDTDMPLADYARDEALGDCRAAAASWLVAHGVNGTAEDLVLTHGAHNAVMVALGAILQGRDPVIATTQLVYPGFRQSAHISRARMVGVASDDDGIDPDALRLVCRENRPQVLLISSNAHNPTCTVTSPARRDAIAELAEEFDFQIIEDDVYGSLISDRPAGFDQRVPHRTWHATSLSKCFAAGLRIGFLLCPPGEGQLGLRVMQGMSLSISQFLTSTVAELFNSGTIDDYQMRLASENTARVEVARAALKEWDVRSTNAVNFVWIRKPPGWTGSAFLRACEDAGVLVAPGDSFTLPGGEAPNAIRLTLSAARNFDELREGLATVNRVLREPARAMLA